MAAINQNDPIKCEVCWDQPPVFLSLITCAHSSGFCEQCVKRYVAEGHFICPKCRAPWPINNYLKRTNQNHLHIMNASLTLDNHPSAISQNIYSPPSSTANGFVQIVFTCCSIGLLLGLIIYPAVKQL